MEQLAKELERIYESRNKIEEYESIKETLKYLDEYFLEYKYKFTLTSSIINFMDLEFEIKELKKRCIRIRNEDRYIHALRCCDILIKKIKYHLSISQEAYFQPLLLSQS